MASEARPCSDTGRSVSSSPRGSSYPGLLPGDEGRPADLSLELASREVVERGWSGPTDPPGTLDMRFPNGTTWRTDPAGPGTSSSRTQRCRRARLEARAARLGARHRGMLHGFEDLHASAIERDGGVVAFMAATGGGKTSLTAELVWREAPLFGDDLLIMRREGGDLLAYPAHPLMNVPLDHPGAISPTELGTEIATLDGEAWVAVDRAAREPLPLRALFAISEEEEAAAPGVQRLDDPGPLLLLRHALRSGTGQERARARFELLSDLAASVPQFLLQRDRAPPRRRPGRSGRASSGRGRERPERTGRGG